MIHSDAVGVFSVEPSLCQELNTTKGQPQAYANTARLGALECWCWKACVDIGIIDVRSSLLYGTVACSSNLEKLSSCVVYNAVLHHCDGH